MPTNLPPEYFEVDRRFRAAESIGERIALLEELISTVPKHKGTDHLRADLRRKLSKLKAEARAKKGAVKRDSVYYIEREGAGQVAVLGLPNVGKSALVAALTNASPTVSPAPFSTWAPLPGMMPIEDIQVQLIDTPPLNREYVEPGLRDLIRRADMILLVVDLQTKPIEQLEEALAILGEHRIVPERLRERHSEAGPVTFKPFAMVVNKVDDEESDELFELFCELLDHAWSCIPVSAATGRGLKRLKEAVFERLDVIRIYAKPPGEEPDLTAPYVMKKGSKLEDFAAKVHQDFVQKLAAARVWGSAAFDGQMVPRDHVLEDGDIVELRI